MKKLFISFLLLMLSGCHIVYRPSVQSGNILKQSTIDQLKLGMTMEQVRYLLGSCVLQSPFQSGRKDYIYFYQPGYAEPIQRRVTLLFSKGRLQKIEKSALN
ncbi:MAG: outer membrane protein assembly factor BamE [Candidatus Aquirickettsiella gammari]|uniref:Outer membrane protein assembly factor BamE n=1 Tax=Candidatus Aquirickettsiella gammari TaxID=2016198 RepID=A0A370CJR8_9COXI|nr:MAG: outer membrane protein assembly factor BamE [Candidatus Aquirickettsiella gammari]